MNNDLIDVKKLRPFTRFCMTIGELPTSYLVSMTYEEQLIWFCNYLEKTVIPTINNNAEAVIEVQNLVIELKEYIENLDLQDEVNNKIDEMVESGELEEILGDYIFKNLSYNNVSVIFPKSQGAVNSGDCTLIKAFNKNIVIDSHRNTTKDGIELFLTENECTHIDYFILTHYHDDHAGNLVSLINDGFIDTTSYIYLPGYSNLIEQSETTLAYYNNVNNAIVSNNIPHEIPNELDTLEIDDFKITFYNCEQTIFNTYNYTDYNDCSTVCLMEYGNIKALFTGDISDKPFIRFNNSNYFNYHINLYKIQHHGINYQYESAIHFLRKITPDYAFQSAELNDFLNNVICQGTDTSFLKHENCRILSSYDNENDIIFKLSKYDLSLTQGKENISQSNRPSIIHLYVDPSSENGLYLGTELKPFTDLPQAFAKISNNPDVRYEIHLANGNYSNGNTTNFQSKITGFNEIILHGNSNDNTAVIIKNGIQLYNGVQLTIENCSFDTNATLLIRNSNLVLKNCIIDGEETDTLTKTLIWSTNSNITIENSTIKNALMGISGHYDNFYITNSTFNNLTTAIQNQYGTVQLNNNTYTSVTNEYNLLKGCRNQSEDTLYRKLLWDGNTNTGDLTLTDSIQKYRYLIFTFGAVNTGQLTSAICIPYRNDPFLLGSTYQVGYVVSYSGTATASLFRFQVDASNNKKITITRCDHESLRTIYGVNLTTENK